MKALLRLVAYAIVPAPARSWFLRLAAPGEGGGAWRHASQFKPVTGGAESLRVCDSISGSRGRKPTPEGGLDGGCRASPCPRWTIVTRPCKKLSRAYLERMSRFSLTDMIRRIVVTVDNMAGPRQAPPEIFARETAGAGVPGQAIDGRAVCPALEQLWPRFPDVSLLKAVDIQKAVAVYVRFYPLFKPHIATWYEGVFGRSVG